MSWDFFRTNLVVGRKDHRCEQCRHIIPAGVQHRYAAGKFDGDFSSYREHVECSAAWSDLNFELRGNDPGEGATFLKDDEYLREDKAWLEAHHPVVAARIWPQAVAS